VSIARKAITGTFWMGSSNHMAFGVSLVGNIILARLLVPEDFGIFALALALNELLYILASFSFSEGVIQIQNEERLFDTAFIFSFLLGGFLVILALALAPLINYFYSRKVSILFLVLCISGLINLLAGVYGAGLQKEFEFKKLSLVQLIASLLSVVLAVGMAFYGFGIWSLAARSVFLSVFSFFGFRWISTYRFQWNINRDSLRKLLAFGYKMFFLRSLEIVYSRIDRFIIGTLSNTITLGLYHQTRYLAELGNVAVGSASASVAFPTYAKYQNNIYHLSESYRLINYFLIRIIFFFALTLFVFPEESIFFLFGEKWTSAASSLRIFSVYALLMPIYGNIKFFLIGIGKIAEAAKTRFVQVVSLIPFLILGTLWKGLEGAAAGTTLAMVIGVAASFYYLKKLCGVLLRTIYGKPIIAGFLTALIFLGLKLYFDSQIKGSRAVYYILAMNITYGLLLFLIENKNLVTNIKFVLKKLKNKESKVTLPENSLCVYR